MRVSAKAEYACIAMLELAANFADHQPVRLKMIADNHRIPSRFLVQILLQLKGAGLVTSIRGASGGYQLTRPPQDVSLGSIINAIDRDGPPAGVAPHSTALQALRAVWQSVQDVEQRQLEGINLADLVRRAYQSNGLSYQI